MRILRDEIYQSNIRGLYPCGEGAGYAGGIVSAGVDGVRCAYAVLADENTRFIVRIAMRPMALGLVESCIVVSVFQFGLRLEMGEAPVAVAPWTFA